MIGAIQSGGRSSRMGRDKAWLELDGRPLIEYVLTAVSTVVEQLIIVVDQNNPLIEHYQELAERWRAILRYDLCAGRGPLSGIEAAFEGCSRTESILILACDLPFITSELLALLRARHETINPAITVPLDRNGHLQPLSAIYAVKCHQTIIEHLASGQLRVDLLYARVPTLRVAYAEFADMNGAERFFTNLNTPEEYRAARKLIRH